MMAFTIWLLVTTSPLTGDVFIASQHQSLLECLQVAAPGQECTEATVLRSADD